jgi:molybdopterin-guanine dinucleotide biosynthesis protein A
MDLATGTVEDDMARDCTGVVLAGGQSRRMGQNKAALKIGGQPLLRRVVGRLQAALPAVLVVGPDFLRTLVSDVPVISDRMPGLGPLGGLATALRAIATPRAFVVACDMPLLAPALVRTMAVLAAMPPHVDALLLRSEHGLEYLHAVYAVTCLPLAERELASPDRSLKRLVRQLCVRELSADEVQHYDPRGLSAFNANTPDEWLRALELATSDGRQDDAG